MIWINAQASSPLYQREMDRTASDVRATPRSNPLDLIESTHRMQLLLCDTLEKIADGLPLCVDGNLCRQAIETLRVDFPLHHLDEEKGLFPLIERRAAPADHLDRILDRLAQEHKKDEGYSAELIESLELLSQGKRPANPDMVGYMLRGFFESYRRHIQWEDAVVMPLARERLTKEDLDDLERIMAQHRSTIPP